MHWIVVMDRVGGYEAYRALCEDDSAYEDVVTVLEAEADAAKLRKLVKDARG